MQFVYVDPSRNLLHIIYVATVGKDEGLQLLGDVNRALLQLTPGFRVLTDLRDLRSVDDDGYVFIRHVMDVCRTQGLTKVVRIVPRAMADFGFGIMSIFHYDRDIAVVNCLNLEEALDRLALQDGKQEP